MKYDIIALKQKMLIKYPFFGNVIASIQYQEDESIPTAMTDGNTIYYNPLFLEELDSLEQIFVIAHEVCHIAFNHILRSKGKDSDVWNIATDAVINQFLKRDGLKIIDGAIDIKEAINYDAEELYQILLDKNLKMTGHDSHSMWAKSNSDSKNNQKNTQKVSSKFQNIGEKKTFEKNIEEKKKRLEEFKESIVNKASLAGNHTYSGTIKINNIGVSNSRIDWRYILKETINYEVDYSYQNATLEDGVVTANLEELSKPEVEIVLDTSGSINETLLKNFLKECKNILVHSKLKVGCFDTKFYGFNSINCEEDIDNMKFIGGGGTDFDVAVRAFSRRIANKILFTDGEATMPNMSLDVIWIVYSNKKINPKGGQVIYITEEQLSKWSLSTNKMKVKKLN